MASEPPFAGDKPAFLANFGIAGKIAAVVAAVEAERARSVRSLLAAENFDFRPDAPGNRSVTALQRRQPARRPRVLLGRSRIP